MSGDTDKHITRNICRQNIWQHIHDAKKYTDEKNYNYNDKTKTRICRSNTVSSQEKTCVEIRKNTETSN